MSSLHDILFFKKRAVGSDHIHVKSDGIRFFYYKDNAQANKRILRERRPLFLSEPFSNLNQSKKSINYKVRTMMVMSYY